MSEPESPFTVDDVEDKLEALSLAFDDGVPYTALREAVVDDLDVEPSKLALELRRAMSKGTVVRVESGSDRFLPTSQADV